MLIYLLVLAIPGVLAMSAPRARSPLVLMLVSVAVIGFVGLRDAVGPDWRQYEYIHENVIHLSLLDLFGRTEPLSYSLFWIDSNLSMGMVLSNLIAASLLVAGVLRLSLATREPWIAFVAAAPYLILIFGMSGVRQGMAIGVLFMSLAHWQNLSFLKRCAYVGIASLFHASALVGGLLTLAGLRLNPTFKAALAVGLGIAIYFATSNVDFYSQSFEQYGQAYLENPDQVYSAGALFHILLVLIPALIGAIYFRKIKRFSHDPKLLQYGLVSVFVVSAVYFVQTTVASRLSLYLYFVPILVYAAFMQGLRTRDRRFMRIAIAGFSMSVLVVWLQFANHSSEYLPYRSVLF